MTDLVQSTAARMKAALISERLTAMIAVELAKEEERRRIAEANSDRMMAICKAMGAATDRLLQAKYTPREGLAREKLEKAAVRLRDEMRRQGGR